MGTYYHKLKTKRPGLLPGRVVTLDCHPRIEPVEGCPRLCRHTLGAWALVCSDYRKGRLFDRRQWVGRSSDDCLSRLESLVQRGRKLWVFAHNLPYDLALSGAWRMVEGGPCSLHHYIIEDPPSVLDLIHPRGRMIWVDCLNFWRKSLREIQSAVLDGESRLPLPSMGHDNPSAVALGHATALALVVDSLLGALAAGTGGGWGPTAAAVAWSAYRSRRWGDMIHVHADPEATKLERAALYGGRIVCAPPGRREGPIHVLDCNNLYGWCMSHHIYPVRLQRVGDCPRHELAVALRNGAGAVACVTLRPTSGDYPSGGNGRTVYNQRRHATVLAGPELSDALDRGAVDTVAAAAVYELGNPFADYVRHWYSLRRDAQENGDKPAAALCKLLTVSLFGRLGQKGRSWEPYQGPPPRRRYCQWWEPNPERDGWTLCRSVAGVAQRQVIRGEWPHSMVACAAYVTSYGRIRMRQLIDVADSAHVLYSDTDSLHVTQEGYDRLAFAGEVHQTRLGALKLVYSSAWAEYWGPKVYSTDREAHCPGSSPTPSEITDGTWIQDRKLGLARLPTDGPPDSVVVQRVELHRGNGRQRTPG